MASQILILEDDRLFNETLQDFLEEEGFEVLCALDPRTALELTYTNRFDLYLLDVNLPFESGFSLLQQLRESGDMTPTIFLTSREDKASLHEGFLSGADDYLRKPVDLDELLLRIRAIMRRQSREELLKLGDYELNLVTKSLQYKGEKQIQISKKAINLLILMLEADGTILTHENIKEQLWASSQNVSEGALRVYITQIKKLFPNAIENVRGVGYIFNKTKAIS